MCVCVCVCVCEKEREGVCFSVFIFSCWNFHLVFSLLCNVVLCVMLVTNGIKMQTAIKYYEM